MFVSIIIVSVLVQVVFVEAFGAFTKTAGITFVHWLISIALGSVSIPLGIFMRFISVKEDPNTFKGYDFTEKKLA
jgi:Ca2+-transporting ATPase